MTIPSDRIGSGQSSDLGLAAAQEALRDANERLQFALEAAQLGTWTWDAPTDQLTLGPRAALMVGLPADTPFTRDQIRARLPAQDAERARQALDRALSERTDYRAEYRVNRADGRQVWIAASGRGHYAPDGSVLGMSGVLQDITEKKREEQALREADARKDEFLATLAHELRNPLAPVRMSLEILRQKGVSRQAEEAARAVILRQVAQMVALIDDLLDISRITMGRIELQRERVALGAVIDTAIEIARPLIDERGHYLSLELPAQPVTLEADRTRMAQLLSNLLNNAAKYTPRNGRIQLSAALDGDAVVITVADSGIGIAPDMLARVFEMFVRVDHSLERAESGLGVGLTLARRLAELHGGSLVAHSAGLGKGSQFVLRLKVAGAAQAAEIPPRAQDPVPAVRPKRKRRVLIVDDNVDHAESLATLLRLDGHEAHTAYSGLEAIEAVSSVRPEIVLLDIGMPGLNGYETARRIHERAGSDEITLVAISGWAQAKDRQLSQASGFDRHLVKPVDPDELRSLIGEDLRRARAPGSRALRVLLADDNVALQESLAYLLEGAGCETRAAPDGERAVEVAKIWHPDVVFVDIHMPVLNGFQVAKRLRQMFSPDTMKLVMMSGVLIDEALSEDAKRAGFDACIDKVAAPEQWLQQLEVAGNA
jgi:PAS domain S-box-containing protein